MKRPITSAVFAATLAVAGLGTAGAAGADTASAQFAGTVSEITDPAADTGIPRRWMRHVGDPAPEGYSHGYQWGAPSITTPAGAVTFTGTIDLVDAVVGNFGLIGLFDTATLAAGERGHQEGSYIYVFMKTEDTVVIGLSDGRVTGGEYVQVFHEVALIDTDRVLDVTFTINPAADPTVCASDATDVATADGCMTLAVDVLPVLTDSYGTITNAAANGGEEFRDGGTAGWDGLASATAATGIDYDLTVTPVIVLEAETKDDCKDGNWEAFGFANQGQCVSTVARA